MCGVYVCVGMGRGEGVGLRGGFTTHFTAESYETDLNMRGHSGIRKTLSYRQIIWVFACSPSDLDKSIIWQK